MYVRSNSVQCMFVHTFSNASTNRVLSDVHFLFFICTLPVLHMYTSCPSYVHFLSFICTLPVLHMYTSCPSYVHFLYFHVCILCTCTCTASPVVHDSTVCCVCGRIPHQPRTGEWVRSSEVFMSVCVCVLVYVHVCMQT